MGLIGFRNMTVTSEGKVTIPSSFIEKHLKDQDEIAVLVYDDHIEIRPLDYLEERFGCAIASEKSLAEFWNTPEEDEAWENLQEKE